MQAETMFRNILTCLRTLTAPLGHPFLFATDRSLLKNRDWLRVRLTRIKTLRK